MTLMKTSQGREYTPKRETCWLHNGDRMTQSEFHRLYETCPRDFTAELVGGVVFLAAPADRSHSAYRGRLESVFGTYQARTPGTEVGINLTAILDDQSEPQPDLLLRLRTEFGGQTRYNVNQYLVGGPEFVAEIAHSSRAIDLGQKREDYFRSGVQEYLVVCIEEKELHWFHFLSRRRLKPDSAGVYKSKAFPGLWLDGPALLAEDAAKVLQTIMAGIATPEHAAFVDRLARRRKK